MEIGVQSRARYAEREWRGLPRVRMQQEQISSTLTTAKAVRWQGTHYDALGEDSHTPPSGGRIPLRELESRPCGTPRMAPTWRHTFGCVG